MHNVQQYPLLFIANNYWWVIRNREWCCCFIYSEIFPSASFWLNYLSYFRKLSKPCPHSPLLGSSDRSSVSDGAEECVAPQQPLFLSLVSYQHPAGECNQALPCGDMLTCWHVDRVDSCIVTGNRARCHNSQQYLTRNSNLVRSAPTSAPPFPDI